MKHENMTEKYQHSQIDRTTRVVTAHGYEYTLIESPDRKSWRLPEACAFNMAGWALKSCKKIEKEK